MVLLGIMILLLQAIQIVSNASDLPALFIFGDSLVDGGNNNYLATTVKASFPNGIDFGNPYGVPSGRFTNGRSVTDLIGEELGLEEFPFAFLDPRAQGDAILKGVNYASAASGILNETECYLGHQIPLDIQISFYAKTIDGIISRIGEAAATNFLHRALHIIVAGSNDVMFGPVDSLSWKPYLDIVVLRFSSQLSRLYELGARKVIVANSPGIGCIPFEKALHHSTTGCVLDMNQRAEEFNLRVHGLIAELTSLYKDSTFVYADVYAMLNEVLQNYASYGFEVTDVGCCRLMGGGNLARMVPCGSTSQICSDRSKFVFWDAFHLTEKAYALIAKQMVDGGLVYMSPMNLRQIMML